MRHARLLAVVGISVLISTTACAAPADYRVTDDPTPQATAAPPQNAEEASQRMGDCLREHGWEVSDGADTNTVQVPPEQADAFQADFTACSDETGASAPGEEYNAEFAGKQYGRTEAFRACLVERGLNPPTLPSYQAYEDALLRGGEIYDLASLTDIAADGPVRETCGDPMRTWGRS